MAVTGSTKQKELYFEVGHCYLLKFLSNKELFEVKVLQLTEKSIKLQWFNNNGTSHTDWIMIDDFNKRYVLFEEIPQQVIPFEKVPLLGAKDYYIEMSEECPVCLGKGEIPEHGSTSGMKQCPKCWGSKRIWKT